MIAKLNIAPIVVLLCFTTPCLAQRYTRQGTVVGGATGAVIGGLIGKQTDKTTGGALIGGAVGAIAGGVMGRQYDNDMARQRYVHQQQMVAQQHYYSQQQYAVVQSGVASQPGISTVDVVSMNRSGVSDSVILSQIQSRGIQRRLEVSDIISLHQQGISDNVLTAMQNAPLAGNFTSASRSVQPVVIQQPSVIVHEQPVIYSSPPVYYEHYSTPVYHYRSGYSRGF